VDPVQTTAQYTLQSTYTRRRRNYLEQKLGREDFLAVLVRCYAPQW